MKLFLLFGKKSALVRIVGTFVLILLFIYLYKLLIPRINAFGCMDDCFNFMGGYFLLHGKKLFSEIFFNHAPLMAYASAYIQFAARPENLHELILRHRQFLLIFSFLSEVLLLLRFGLPALPFAFVYELSKFYLGGDRFLAEGFIVYPIVYLLGIVFEKFIKKYTLVFDYFVSAVLVWFVLFMREPYSVLVLLLFAAFLWGREKQKIKLWSFTLLIALSLITFFSHNPYEFFYNVVYVNKTILTAENTDTHFLGINLYRSFVYPLLIFFQGEWNFVRYIEMGIAVLFLFANGIFLLQKKWQWLIFLWIVLGIANIRYITPGHEYYGAFHLLPWFAMTIFITCLMLWENEKREKIFAFIGFVGLTALVLFILFSKASYTHDTIDQQTEFITNYGQVLQIGSVVGALSKPNQTLFVDGFDDTIYFTAHRYSPYQYAWYTSLMPQYKKYTHARIRMFQKSPPDFYYGSCPKEKAPYYLLPDFIKNNYTRLYNQKDLSCLWIKKSVLSEITDSQWQKAGESLYYLQPKN